MFEEKYDWVKIIPYAVQPKNYIDKLLKSIKSMGANYVYLTDINLALCITAKKQNKRNNYKNIDKEKIVVVIREIESWYLAGLDNINSQKLRISSRNTTDDLTKEQFNHLIPKGFDSRIVFMSEIMKYFSIETAKQKNRSFSYFIEKHCEV